MDHLDNVQMVHSQYHGDNLGEDPHCVDNMSDNGYLNETTTFIHNNGSHNFTYLMVLAKYFMSLEADHKMTKTSVTSVAALNKHLMATVLAKCTSKIEKLLRDLNISPCDINDVVKHFNLEMCEEVMNSADVFLTEHQRQLVYTNVCRMIHPVSVLLGYRVVCLRGKKQRKKQIGYCVPLNDQLQRLLNLPEVWHFFRNPSMSNDGIHRDINDCKYVKSHRFQEDPTNFLKIALYYDDVEIQNPLRSSQKYKLSMFYFQLLNIPVQFRSKLSSVSLLAVCRSKNLQKFGVKNILRFH